MTWGIGSPRCAIKVCRPGMGSETAFVNNMNHDNCPPQDRDKPATHSKVTATRPDLDWLGTPSCGLIGPHAFPFQWTFQRRRAGHISGRGTVYLHLPLMQGRPLYVEGVTIPIRRIRHAALELVDAVWHLFFVSGAYDPSILASLGTGADWDLLQPILPQQCGREGSRLFLERARRRFINRYAGWQVQAEQNGRFFPPPMVWNLTVHSQGNVQVLLGWSEGFSPSNKVWVTQRIADVSSGESVLYQHAHRVTEWR